MKTNNPFIAAACDQAGEVCELTAPAEAAYQAPMSDDELDLLCEKALFGRVSYQQLARSVEQHHGIGLPSPAWCASVDAELAATAEADAEPVAYTYSSTQATNCASCGKHKHTPLRIDAMGGYICLTCIDSNLGEVLGEFGYPAPQEPMTDAQIEDLRADANRGYNIEREDYFKAFRDAEAAHGIKCLTCNGHGLIGGFQGGAAPGYVSEDCPDCNAPATTLPATAVAEGAQLDGESLEQGE